MKLAWLLVLGAACLGPAWAPKEARASVSVAVLYDDLLKGSDAAAVVAPTSASSVWENGRIYTYTKLRVERTVGGSVGTGQEVLVRTMGGVVENVGQHVDGEPVFTTGQPCLVFLKKAASGTFVVQSRAQGQYAIVADENDPKVQRFVRSSGAGLLLPPKAPSPAAGQAQTQSVAPGIADAAAKKFVFASDKLHNRVVEDAVRELALAWKRAHAP